MAFSTVCTNKGCGKQMEPYIDPKEDKVYCSLCDKELVNMTYFAKSQMKSSKQYKKIEPKPFAVKCIHCNHVDRPIIVKDDLICSKCKKIFTNLSEHFKIMLKNLKNFNSDI